MVTQLGLSKPCAYPSRAVRSPVRGPPHLTRPLDALVRPTYKFPARPHPPTAVRNTTTVWLSRPVRKRSHKFPLPIAPRRRHTSRCRSPFLPFRFPFPKSLVLARAAKRRRIRRRGREGDQRRWRRGRRPRTSSRCGAPPPSSASSSVRAPHLLPPLIGFAPPGGCLTECLGSHRRLRGQ